MKIPKLVGVAVVLSLAIGLSACAQSTKPVIAPVSMSAGELQGQTVELVVGQVLNINTDDLAVDSYSGKVADPAVAEFVKGYKESGTSFNPGVEALAEGTTEVVLSNSDGGIEDVTFTVQVSKRAY